MTSPPSPPRWGENFIEKPGLHRTLVGDGVATALAGLFGGPANTTYGENTGVLALSRVHDPRVIRLAALYAMVLSFSPAFAYLVNTIPAAIIGGGQLHPLWHDLRHRGAQCGGEPGGLYQQPEPHHRRGNFGVRPGLYRWPDLPWGGVTITLTSLAVAAIAGIVLNAILPGNDFHFGKSESGDDVASLGRY